MARQTPAPGYALGDREIPSAPITTMDLRRIEATATFDDADREMLRRSKPILKKRLDALAHAWLDFLLDHDHLNAPFRGPEADGNIVPRYVEAVRERLKEWLLDSAEAKHDQAWLDYQFEIGRRLHRTKKNQTDGVQANDHVSFRYLLPAIMPMVAKMRPILEQDGAAAQDVDRMLTAWMKVLTVQVTLWSHAYVRDADF